MKKFISALAVVVAVSGTAHAQDFQKGYAAYKAGDYATALQEWRPLAVQGDANAQHNLGLMYSNGDGVPQDYAGAVKWFRLAADQGDANAQYNLGLHLRNGIGTLQDYSEAVKWFQLGAQQGNAFAQSQLGYSYQFEHGLPQDNIKAHMWLNIASANGHDASGSGRMELASQMTSAEISKAQAMARECMSSAYEKCGY